MDSGRERMVAMGTSTGQHPDERSETIQDARLGGLLDSLSGQVHEAFSCLGQMHTDLRAQKQAVIERERELARRAEELEQRAQASRETLANIDARCRDLDVRAVALDEREKSQVETEHDLEARAQSIEAMTRALEARDVELQKAMESVQQKETDARGRATELATAAEEIEAQRRLLTEAEAELEGRAAAIRAREQSVEAMTSALGEREVDVQRSIETVRQREDDVRRREVDLVTAADELEELRGDIAALRLDLDERASVVRAREAAIAQWYSLLVRMQASIVEVPASGDADAATKFEEGADVEAVEDDEGPVTQANVGATDCANAVDPDDRSQDAWEQSSADAAESVVPPPTIDLSDFSPDELAKFNVRRRLRAYGDEFIAAEIRAERAAARPQKKHGSWFHR